MEVRPPWPSELQTPEQDLLVLDSRDLLPLCLPTSLLHPPPATHHPPAEQAKEVLGVFSTLNDSMILLTV